MSEIGATDRRAKALALAGVDGGLLGPVAEYLRVLEARVVLERRSSWGPLMTATDAAGYARVSVETVLRAGRAGELEVAGFVGRSPRISCDAADEWLYTRSRRAASASPRARQGGGAEASGAVVLAWRALA